MSAALTASGVLLTRIAGSGLGRDEKAEIIDFLTSENGTLDVLDAVPDPDGAFAGLVDELLDEPGGLDLLLSPDDLRDELDAAASDDYADDLDSPDEADDAYQEALDGLHERAAGDQVRLDEPSFSPYIIAADGDLDKAYEGYREWFRGGEPLDARDTFQQVAGDAELAAAGESRWREYSEASRGQLRADRQAERAAEKAAEIKSRPMGSDEYGFNAATADLSAAMQASKELRDSDGPQHITGESWAGALDAL